MEPLREIVRAFPISVEISLVQIVSVWEYSLRRGTFDERELARREKLKTFLRMRFPKYLLIALVFLVKGATAASNSTVLDPGAKPIQDVAIIVGMGTPPQNDFFSPEWYSTKLKEALASRLPAIFSANGIPVRSVSVTSALNFDEPWGHTGTDGSPSHYLVLNAYRFISGGGQQDLFFEASLWSAREQKKVWKAYPSLGLVVDQPLLRTQLMAAQLLEELRNDRLLTLHDEIPVDLTGEPITKYWIFTKDR